MSLVVSIERFRDEVIDYCHRGHSLDKLALVTPESSRLRPRQRQRRIAFSILPSGVFLLRHLPTSNLHPSGFAESTYLFIYL